MFSIKKWVEVNSYSVKPVSAEFSLAERSLVVDLGLSFRSLIFLAPTSEEPYISECLCLSMYLWKNCSNLTSELYNSAPDHLIELKFGTLNHLRMFITMLRSEGCPGVSLRVPWGDFGSTPELLWRYFRGHIVCELGSLWGDSRITLEVCLGLLWG